MSERDELVRRARRLETLAADDSDPEAIAQLTEFNRRAGADYTLGDFKYLYSSQEPEEFVDDVLALRDMQPVPADPSRDELLALVARSCSTGSSYADGERAGQALQAQSALPNGLAYELGSGFGMCGSWEPGEIVDFALAYRTPRSAEELFAFARLWAEDWVAGRETLHAQLGANLVAHAQTELALPQLAPLMRAVQQERDALMRTEMVRLGLVSALPAAESPIPEAPAPESSAAADARTLAK